MRLAIDYGNEGRAGYGRIHKLGCRDLDDAETLRNPATRNDITTPGELVAAFNRTTCWDDYSTSDILALLAPCARTFADDTPDH